MLIEYLGGVWISNHPDMRMRMKIEYSTGVGMGIGIGTKDMESDPLPSLIDNQVLY